MGRGSQNMMYGQISKRADLEIRDDLYLKAINYKMVLPDLASKSRNRVTDSVFINYPAIHNYNRSRIYSSGKDEMLFSLSSNHLWLAVNLNEDIWDNVRALYNLDSSKFSSIKEQISKMKEYQSNLIPISFNLLKLSDAEQLKLFFYPQNQPDYNQYSPLVQDNLRDLVHQVNQRQTIINSGAVSAVERTIGGRVGEWYYAPYQSQGSIFQFYYKTGRGQIIGSLEHVK
jgi:hypothetical protein